MSEERIDGDEDESGSNPFAVGRNGSSVSIVDPAEVGGDPTGSHSGAPSAGTGSESGNAPKRRGRKPGSKNGTKAEAKSKPDISGLETILFSVHLALGAVTKTPELALDISEARELAKAAAAVQSHYETVIDPKLMAWAQLLIVAGGIYTPRFIAISVRTKKERAERRKTNVVQAQFGNQPHAPTG